ncbi:uncharacterized protein LOC110724430 [Chenopodium quinoa]|uniref:uncharacterized protein LOC110724430 n=1 Tax=Chenopodium quinoa TaxID=63459 RepID=UPI000B7914F6|nr:uncharacterized protein LOC110724430 [Chenopodium quinoa]
MVGVEKACPCGLGICLVLTANTERNRGQKFFRCPNRQMVMAISARVGGEDSFSFLSLYLLYSLWKNMSKISMLKQKRMSVLLNIVILLHPQLIRVCEVLEEV